MVVSGGWIDDKTAARPLGRAAVFYIMLRLDKLSFFQGLVGTILGDSTQRLSRDSNTDGLTELRHVNTLLLEIR